MLDSNGRPLMKINEKTKEETEIWKDVEFKIHHWATETMVMEDATIGRFVSHVTVIWAENIEDGRLYKLDPLACNIIK